MALSEERRLLLAAVLALSLALSTGCASETGRSTMGGLVYGSMVGTTIAPGIGSAIGAGVGMLAGAVEGVQREKEKEQLEETYRQKFYRLRGEAEKADSESDKEAISSYPPEQSERFGNLLALQEREPVGNLISKEQSREPEGQGRSSLPGEVSAAPENAAGEVSEGTRLTALYRELASLIKERREMEDRVSRVSAMLEEYNRSERKSPDMVEKMEQALELSTYQEATAEPPKVSPELKYLQEEYDMALLLDNSLLADAIATRYERISGKRPLRSSKPTLPSGF